jgi:hypothetical protein
MYALYRSDDLNKYVPTTPIKIEEFPDLETAPLAAEKMEESKCQKA